MAAEQLNKSARCVTAGAGRFGAQQGYPLPRIAPALPLTLAIQCPHPRCTAGTTETASEQKKGYKLPRHIMANGDLARLINSDEIQSVVNPQVKRWLFLD